MIYDNFYSEHIPQHVRERWGRELVLDLDPGWPIGLDFDDSALYADLGFQGLLVRCRIPYRAVWGVLDRATQAGTLIPSQMPESFRSRLQASAAEPAQAAAEPRGEAPRTLHLAPAAAAKPEGEVDTSAEQGAPATLRSVPASASAEPDAPPGGPPAPARQRARRPRLTVVKGGKSG
jgi:hypothetical protein